MKKLIKIIKENNLILDFVNLAVGLLLIIFIILVVINPNNMLFFVIAYVSGLFLNLMNTIRYYKNDSKRMIFIMSLSISIVLLLFLFLLIVSNVL